MPTRKLYDLPRPCMSSDHNPPSMMVFPPGVYEHICSACGHRITFTVYPGPTSMNQTTWVNRGPAPEIRWDTSQNPYEKITSW